MDLRRQMFTLKKRSRDRTLLWDLFIVKVFAEGETFIPNIASMAECSEAIVRLVLKRVDNEESADKVLFKQASRVQKKKVLLEAIDHIVKRKDRIINATIIQLELERTRRLKPSISTIQKYLKLLRYRWKRTQPI